jgi:DNA-binding SARP family transcriptional activator
MVEQRGTTENVEAAPDPPSRASVKTAGRAPAAVAARGRSFAIRLRLLDAFALEIDGGAIDLPHGAQRLLAFLALRPHALARGFMAGSLWLDATDERAAANLRSALWRLRHLDSPIVVAAHGTLRLDPGVWVDVREASELARRWLGGRATVRDASASPLLESELLPDWYDDWVVDERERFRQLRLHALETMTERLIEMGRFGDALLAALAAMTDDPLRESAQRALIKVHLAEGNTGEAVRQLRRCERLFERDLGVRPSAQLTKLVAEAAVSVR